MKEDTFTTIGTHRKSASVKLFVIVPFLMVVVLLDKSAGDDFLCSVDPVAANGADVDVGFLRKCINMDPLRAFLEKRIYGKASRSDSDAAFVLSAATGAGLRDSGGVLRVSAVRSMNNDQKSVARIVLNLSMTLLCIGIEPGDVVKILARLDPKSLIGNGEENAIAFDEQRRVSLNGEGIIGAKNACRIFHYGREKKMVVVASNGNAKRGGYAAFVLIDAELDKHKNHLGMETYYLAILGLLQEDQNSANPLHGAFEKKIVRLMDVRDFTLYVNDYLSIEDAAFRAPREHDSPSDETPRVRKSFLN